MVERMQGSQLSQCSIIRKFFLSATILQESAAYGVLRVQGVRQLPIAALIRPLVNFDFKACAGDLIMKAAPGSGRGHEHFRCKGDLSQTSCSRPGDIAARGITTRVSLHAARPLGGRKRQVFCLRTLTSLLV
jgi:hypothetical protein